MLKIYRSRQNTKDIYQLVSSYEQIFYTDSLRSYKSISGGSNNPADFLKILS